MAGNTSTQVLPTDENTVFFATYYLYSIFVHCDLRLCFGKCHQQ